MSMEMQTLEHHRHRSVPAANDEGASTDEKTRGRGVVGLDLDLGRVQTRQTEKMESSPVIDNGQRGEILSNGGQRHTAGDGEFRVALPFLVFGVPIRHDQLTGVRPRRRHHATVRVGIGGDTDPTGLGRELQGVRGGTPTCRCRPFVAGPQIPEFHRADHHRRAVGQSRDQTVNLVVGGNNDGAVLDDGEGLVAPVDADETIVLKGPYELAAASA